MNAIRNLETLDCKDTRCQKIDSVIYLRTSVMKVGEKRCRDAREELALVEMREKNLNRNFYFYFYLFIYFFRFYMLT